MLSLHPPSSVLSAVWEPIAPDVRCSWINAGIYYTCLSERSSVHSLTRGHLASTWDPQSNNVRRSGERETWELGKTVTDSPQQSLTTLRWSP